jgi:hypothetical protein
VQELPAKPDPLPVTKEETVEYQPSMIKALRNHSSFAVLQAEMPKKPAGEQSLADKLQEQEIQKQQ